MSGRPGAELRREREAKGISQAGLARLTNFSRGYLCNVEQGTKPLTAALAAACDRVLGGDLAALVDAVPARRTAWGGLPPVPADFTGRAAELDRAARVLTVPPPDALGGAVCCLAGLGGAGKTALAVRVAHWVRDRFPDGCLFIDLHGFDEETALRPGDALLRLLTQLGTRAAEIPAHPEDRAALFRAVLADLRLLLVLDNAWDAGQVLPLLPSAPGCATLVTSRDALTGIDAAERVVLGPLPRDEAVALLRGLFRGTWLGEAELRRIASWAGRLPLALRIAPATFADVAPEELAERLSEPEGRLGDFDDGARSLTAAFEHSLRRLDEPLRRTFLLLGVHPGPDFDAQAAAALLGAALPETRRSLRRLRELSLLTAHGRGRYQFHDLVRLFAAASARRLPEPERVAALARVIDHYRSGMAAADRLLAPDRFVPHHYVPAAPGRPPRTYGEAFFWCVTERENLAAACRAAFEAGLDERCWALAYLLRGFFFLTKPWSLWRESHELAADAARRAGDRRAEAMTLNNLGLVHLELGDAETAGDLYRRAEELFTEVGDMYGVHTSIAHRAWVHVHRGDLAEAHRESLLALEFAEREETDRKRAILLRDIALIENRMGRYDEAISRLAAAVPIFAAAGSRVDLAMARNCLGEAYLGLGRADDAEAVLTEALRIGGAGGSDHERGRALENLADVERLRGRPARARERLHEALDLYRRLRDERAVRRISLRLDWDGVNGGVYDRTL